MFGLPVEESYIGYVGWRAILQRGRVIIVPNRTSSIGDKKSQYRLFAWVNKPMVLPPLAKRKRPRKVTPWKQLHEAANTMTSSSRESWEISEGPFVLRANPRASYGYLYIALFERNLSTDSAAGDGAVSVEVFDNSKYDSQFNVSVIEAPPETPVTLVSPLGDVDPIPEPQHPKMVIHNHTVDWMPTYQAYQKAVAGETADRERLCEVVKSINAHRAEQARCTVQLAKMGVEIQEANGKPFVEVQPEPTIQPPALLPPFKEGKRRGRIVMDRYIVSWGKNLRAQVVSGARIAGTLNSWAAELGVSWLTVQSRTTMLHDIVGLTFTDAQGRSGSKARGSLTVGLK